MPGTYRGLSECYQDEAEDGGRGAWMGTVGMMAGSGDNGENGDEGDADGDCHDGGGDGLNREGHDGDGVN